MSRAAPHAVRYSIRELPSKQPDLTRPMAVSTPRHLALKGAISALDVIAACGVGFAAFLALGALGDSGTIGTYQDDSGGKQGIEALAVLLGVGALIGLVFALEVWCARSCMTAGKNAVYFYITAVAAVVVTVVGDAKAPFVVLTALPPLIGCGLSAYCRSLLKREQSSRGDAEVTLIRELLVNESHGTAYSRGVTGLLRVAHPTVRAESPAATSQKTAAPASAEGHQA